MHRVRYGRFKSYDLPENEALPDGIVKICKIHGELTEKQVYTNERYIWAQCLQCKKDTNQRFAERNPGRDTNILKKDYLVHGTKIKMSKSDYNLMLEIQNHVCAICKLPERIPFKRNGEYKLKRLAIDHEPGTNNIRGLLCHKCNVSLGAMGESIERLESAIAYLKKHQSNAV